MAHLDLGTILAYVAGRNEYDEVIETAAHLAVCEMCAKRVFAFFHIHRHFDEIFDAWSASAHREAYREAEAKRAVDDLGAAGRLRTRELMQRFFRVATKKESHLWDCVEEMSLGLYDILLNIFATPAPAFAPVFGEGRVSVLSPFGKIRLPIVFAWEPLEGADRYRVSIEESGWSQLTTGRSLIVEPGEFALEYGREYLWSMEALRSDCRMDLISGFFLVPPKSDIEEIDEMERQLDTLEDEAQRLILMAAILEQRGFYQEAALKYQRAFEIEPFPGIAFRTACCFDRLELEELRDRWNREVLRLNEAAGVPCRPS